MSVSAETHSVVRVADSLELSITDKLKEKDSLYVELQKLKEEFYDVVLQIDDKDQSWQDLTTILHLNACITGMRDCIAYFVFMNNPCEADPAQFGFALSMSTRTMTDYYHSSNRFKEASVWNDDPRVVPILRDAKRVIEEFWPDLESLIKK